VALCSPLSDFSFQLSAFQLLPNCGFWVALAGLQALNVQDTFSVLRIPAHLGLGGGALRGAMRQTLRSNEPHRREEGADAARITGEQGQMGDVGVRADEEMSEVRQDHAALRVRRNQLSVSPLTFPPRSSTARTRLPRESLLALTTSTPSGWSTNSTSRCGSSPCFYRMAGGTVT